MLKKSLIVVFFIILCSSVVLAQVAEESGQKEKPKFGFNMNFSLGLSSYEDINGDQIAFQKFGIFPEFTYGKWGLGLDLTLELDGDFQMRDIDKDGKPDRWSNFTDYLYKIYYVRYGHKGDPLYGRIGAFEGYTLGHGLIMDGFSNTLFYPQVLQLGLNLDIDGRIFNFPLIGMESVVDDVLDWDIMGLRVYARPFMNMETPIIKDLKVGGTIVTDLDPQEKPPDSPKDDPLSESVTEYGIDIELPLLERQNMNLIAYADWAKISGKGSGSFIGSTYTYQWFRALAQLRFFGKEFVPNYFDAYYEQERRTIYDDEGKLVQECKYDKLSDYTERYMGYLIGTELGLFNILNFFFYWSDGFNDPEGPRIQSGIGTAENAIPKIDASFTYDKKDIDGFRDLRSKEDSLMQLKVAYKISAITSLVFIYERTYSPYTGEVTDRTFIETQFSF